MTPQLGTPDRWLWRPRPRDHARYRLLCFPFAGSGPRAFQGWDRWLAPDVELLGVRLPGRENRLAEPAYDHWPTLIDAAADALAPWLDRPFAVFGHSFGGQLAFQLGARWSHEPRAGLRLVAVSACSPPHSGCTHQGLARLNRKPLFATLARWGGMPEEALADEAFTSLFEPTLRADMRLAEAWHELPRCRITTPLAAFAGTDDAMATPRKMREWACYADGGFTFTPFQGDHFFLHQHPRQLVSTLTSMLRSAAI
ncbi:MAG: alpha/beta fold hydrolase [Planctomycetota bacterium]